MWCCLYRRGLPESDLVTFEWSHLSRNTVIHQLHIQISLCLCVADYLTEVIASHSEGIAIAITELGATYLSVCHTLIVQMGNLKGKEGHSLTVSENSRNTDKAFASILDLLKKYGVNYKLPPRCWSLGSMSGATPSLESPQQQTEANTHKHMVSIFQEICANATK